MLPRYLYHCLFLGITLTIPIGCHPGASIPSASQTPSTHETDIKGMDQNSRLSSHTEAQIWQNDPLLKQYSQWLLQQRIPIAIDGAIGTNQQHPDQVQVGWQRDGFKAIAYGMSAERPDVVKKGLLAFQWAFDRQGSDGRFGVSGYPEVVSFLGAYARSLLLLRDAGYREEAMFLAQYLPQLQATLEHPDFQTLEQRWENEEQQRPLTNQLFWAALSYELIHQVRSQPRLHGKAKTWIKLGLQRQSTQGVFPEKGGSDTNYQAVSLQMLNLFSCHNAEARQIIQPYLRKGFTWLTRKVLPDNTMDISENTRTGKKQERGPSGEFKQGHLGDPEIFIFWSHLGGGEPARQLATRLMAARVTFTGQRQK